MYTYHIHINKYIYIYIIYIYSVCIIVLGCMHVFCMHLCIYACKNVGMLRFRDVGVEGCMYLGT